MSLYLSSSDNPNVCTLPLVMFEYILAQILDAKCNGLEPFPKPQFPKLKCIRVCAHDASDAGG